ncbi:MAG: STAS domain-containing protein [Bacteroidales bacterium]|nr:STAS domain-containing protein [Bacteroidales bacterium]
MEITILKENETSVVVIEGRVDTVTAPELESAVKPLINMGTSVVFECEKLEYISSAGLRVVLAAHKQLTACAGKFVIRHLNREVKSVFDITGFSKILNIEE